MPRIALFEDRSVDQFRPIALLRPVCELRCGHFTPRERALELLPDADWGVCIRPGLCEVYQEEHPTAHVNDCTWLRSNPTLFLNSRWLGDVRDLLDAPRDAVGAVEDAIAWMWVTGDEAAAIDPGAPDEGLARIASGRRKVAVADRMVSHPWDLVSANGEQLHTDFSLREREAQLAEPEAHLCIQGKREDVFIHARAEIDPFVVIDARNGPVWIDADTRVLPFTRLEGPCFIGRQSQLFRAHIREGTTIGPVCRVGGEIEESIFQGYANKYHDGFVGHSFICPWVNLGALTSSSDLKNDYSSVRVPIDGIPRETGLTKVGCFVGDHTKTALCSMLNTGTAVGVMTMLLPAGELMPKHVPSFARLWHGMIEELPGGVDSAITAARVMMARRDQTLTDAMERLLRRVFEETSVERRRAIERSLQRQGGKAPAPTSRGG